MDRVLQLVQIGSPIILLDDVKEREGDLFCAASVATPEVLQFMVRRGSGLLCMSQPRLRLEDIGIPRMSEGLEMLSEYAKLAPPRANISYSLPGWQKFLTSLDGRLAETPFHFPVDLARHESGISVVERLETIQALLDPDATMDWFNTPGHLFTLGAHAEGMKGRWGHTEASVDLCRAAGLPPAGLLCEIVGDDGSMLRGEDLEAFAAETNVEILTVSAVPELLNRQAEAIPA